MILEVGRTIVKLGQEMLELAQTILEIAHLEIATNTKSYCVRSTVKKITNDFEK